MNSFIDKKRSSKIIVGMISFLMAIYSVILLTGNVEFELYEVGEVIRDILLGYSLKRTCVLLLILICLVLTIYNLIMLWYNDSCMGEKVLLISSVLFIGALYFWMAINLNRNAGPDEYMRYDLSHWIFEHGRLPIGDEPELLNEIWGLSYGFTPYLPSIISAVFMKIASVFTTNGTIILMAARMTSVLSGVGVYYLAIKCGEKFFEKKYSKYLFAFLLALIPQFIFMCGYHNNDTMALFAVMLIIYAWLIGIKSHWGIRQTVLLAVGISICMLCYFNAYGYILCSIVVCIGSVLRDKEIKIKWKFLMSRIAIVVGVVLVLAGWYFIRNIVIYDGDALGITTSRECAEEYAQEEYKPSNRGTLANTGGSIMDIVESHEWKEIVVKSTIGIFGYMSVGMYESEYARYIVIFAIGWFLFIQYFYKHPKQRIWIGPFLLCIIIPIFLNMYYSYANDYQPQGRYSFSCMPILALLATGGYESFISENDKINRRISISVILIAIMSAMMISGRYMAQQCFFDI